MKNVWEVSKSEKLIIASLIEKGKAEEKRNDKFAIIDFEGFYKLFSNEETALFKKYFRISPKDINYKLPYLGIQKPESLISITDQKYLLNGKVCVLPTQYLPKIVFDVYQKMNLELAKDLGKKLLVEYGYRTPARQVFLFFEILQDVYDYDFLKTMQRVCFPDYSEHVCPQKQAIDFITTEGVSDDFDKTEEYKWLQKQAEQFGFFESYPKDNALGMMYEPWHWHYEE